MKKNSQIHLMIETELLEAIKKQASDSNMNLSEFCRNKLRETSQLTRMEILLENINRAVQKNVVGGVKKDGRL